METINHIAWMVVLIAGPILFCGGILAIVILMERDMKIAEKRWYNQQLREQINGTRS